MLPETPPQIPMKGTIFTGRFFKIWEVIPTTFIERWRATLASMLTAPWQPLNDPQTKGGTARYISKDLQLSWWILGWLLGLAGIIGTGIFMPYLVLAWHVPVAWENWAVIIGALLGGIISQALSTLIVSIFWNIAYSREAMIAYQRAAQRMQDNPELPPDQSKSSEFMAIFDEEMDRKEDASTLAWVVSGEFLSVVLPLALAGFAVYWYFTNFAPHHDLVGTGIIGATLLKLAISFGPTVIKGIFSGYILRWFLKKIKGEPPEQPKGTAPT